MIHTNEYINKLALVSSISRIFSFACCTASGFPTIFTWGSESKTALSGSILKFHQYLVPKSLMLNKKISCVDRGAKIQTKKLNTLRFQPEFCLKLNACCKECGIHVHYLKVY